MKVRYDGEEDILMIKVSDEPIDYAEQADSIIVHLTKEGKPVLLEILDATEFLSEMEEAFGDVEAVGRMKDMVITRIEAILSKHPKVRQIAIVPVPDPVRGERACAYVVPTPGEKLTLEDLTSFLKKEKVAKFKWPERLELIEELPRTPVGKIEKDDLREDIARKLKAEGKI
jgi:acyl-CoA synthetase (AMP-forming)/AMP-acid ligase II